MAPLSLIIFAGAVSIWVFSKVIAALTSPLNKIPSAHFSAPFSRLWLLWIRGRGKEITSCNKAHSILGPVIRIGPNEISINCMTNGVQTVFNTNWDKAAVFGNFKNYGHNPLFAIVEGKAHANRKRIYTGVYNKSTIDSSAELKNIMLSKGKTLQNRIRQWISNDQVVNMLPIAEAYNMDVMSSYLYGLSHGTQWLENDEEALPLLDAFQTVLEPWAYFAFTEISGLVELGAKFGISLVPSRVYSAIETVQPYVHKMTKRAIDDLGLKRPNETSVSQTFEHMLNKLAESKVSRDQQCDLLASDLLDQLHAAHEATGISVIFALWHLSKNQAVQAKLRAEMALLVKSGQSMLQSRLLEDVILETIRLHPAAFGPFPRTAPDGVKVGGFDLPAGTIVSASPFWLGRNHEVFPEPHVWNPARWTNANLEERKSMRKWVWTFTSGSRMCIGEHLAMIAMKSFIADIYICSKTTIAKESNMKQLESFIALPEDASLFLTFDST